MSAKSAILLAAAIFLLTVLVRLPAAVLTLFLPDTVHCQAPAGTLWRGACGELRSGPLALSDVRWVLHPLALLHAQLSADIDSEDARANGRAQIKLRSNGDLEVRALNATLPLQGGLQGLMPVGWSGTLELAIEQASIHGDHLAAVQGVITVQRLHRDQPAADLGGFELKFINPEPMTGNLRDPRRSAVVAGRAAAVPERRLRTGRHLGSERRIEQRSAARAADAPGRRMRRDSRMLRFHSPALFSRRVQPTPQQREVQRRAHRLVAEALRPGLRSGASGRDSAQARWR